MKFQILITALLSVLMNVAIAQPIPLPAGTEVIPYTLKVGFNKTTVLLFPAAIKDADRGWQDIIVGRQSGLDNILKLKAGRKDFVPSNLHVFTKDGRIYSFEILYGEGCGGTYDLSRLPPTRGKSIPSMTLIFPDLDDAAPETRLRLDKVEASRPFFATTVRKHQLRLQLLSIHFDHDRLYFRYRIRNRSALPYQIDFSRMYITDGRQVRRSTSQQQEITPEFTSGEKLVPGHSSIEMVFVLKRFTIPEARKFQLEFFEKDGGRNIRMELRNRHLFRARPLF